MIEQSYFLRTEAKYPPELVPLLSPALHPGKLTPVEFEMIYVAADAA